MNAAAPTTVASIICGTVASIFFIFGCAGPVDENAPDYAEFESVRQHLKVYSIYQDRVPADPFAFETPEDIMLAIADTLYGSDINHHYTRYLYDVPPAVTTTSSAESIAPLAVAGNEIVTFDSLTDSTACIKIKSFEYGVTFNQFMALLPKVYNRFPNLIIDLRSNGGGEIDEATSIIDAFLPVNTPYIQAREREYHEDTHTDTTIDWHPWRTVEIARVELRDKKIVILMDANSASASEIVIAALKDGPTGATLVGTRSYGKGIGQIRLQRRDRLTLQITFLQLKGITDRTGDYHHKGIEPDIPASGTCEQWLLTAVQVHEPQVTSLPPQNPCNRNKQAPRFTLEPAGYRVVYEE
ncbi:MAG: hypothetical protein JW863_05995 [Chitinispirillaceae bacterium]|nr:hypothetical protein [Chitinispirillaceae bacterium]